MKIKQDYGQEIRQLGTAIDLLAQAELGRSKATGRDMDVRLRAILLVQALTCLGQADELVRISIARLCDLGGRSPQLTETLQKIDRTRARLSE